MAPVCVFRADGLVELEDLYDSEDSETITLSGYQEELIQELLWTIGAYDLDPKEVLKKLEQTAKDVGAFKKPKKALPL